MKRIILLAALATVTASAEAQVTSLMENFNVCDTTIASGARPTGWTTFNKTGTVVWKWYSRFGVDNSPVLGLNGYVGGTFTTNDDWLITPQMDLSAMTNAYLNFYIKGSFYGPDLEISYSTNYTGSGDPMVSGVTWTPCTLIGATMLDTAKFSPYQPYTANLTSVKSTPLYVAFRYTSNSTSATFYDVDSVFTSEARAGRVGVDNINAAAENVKVSVLGEATSNNINVFFNASANAEMELSVTDMSGRKVYSKIVSVADGSNNFRIDGVNLSTGMYLVAVRNESGFGVAKAMVK
jgi:hypothetical protein